MVNHHDFIVIKGAKVHNLKNIDVKIPKNKFVVITGLSGSGKSSLAFDTIYAEGQRRYVESLSAYARQFLELQDKPDVQEISGLSPTIAIEQRTITSNPRSTVGTITEVYDYLRLIYSRAGRAHCPTCRKLVTKIGKNEIATQVRTIIDETAVKILAAVVKDQKGLHKHILDWAEKNGFSEVRYNGIFAPISEIKNLNRDREARSTIEIVLAEHEEFGDAPNLEAEIGKALELADGSVIVYRQKNQSDAYFSERLTCSACGLHLPELEPRIFSFNSPHGACPECTGLGNKLEVEPELVIPNRRLTLAQGAIKPWTRIAGNQNWYAKLIAAVAARHNFSVDNPIGELSKAAFKIIMAGTGDEDYVIDNRETKYIGVVKDLESRHRETDSEYLMREIEGYMNMVECPACLGKRLRPDVLAVTFGNKSIAEIVGMSMEDMHAFFTGLLLLTTKIENNKVKIPPTPLIEGGSRRRAVSTKVELFDAREAKIALQPLREIVTRLKNLIDVGLGYLSLDRSAITLSGGELQRVRLATQLGSGLSGVIYVLDEPSIGLHSRDNDKLIDALKHLRDQGNSIVVVEHDAATIAAADYVIDMGPGAGIYGGEILAAGTPSEIRRNKNSLTGRYLTGAEFIPTPKKYRKGNGKFIVIKGATEFNLKNVDVKIPLGQLVCITGVSGSGKSTLILDILSRALMKKLYRAKDIPGQHKEIRGLQELDKVISIDQTPIGRTPRSNPATYTGVFTLVRDLFTEVPEAKMKGYDAGKFSFNVKGGGRCEACSGEGLVRIEMQFLPDVYVECTECRGKRYNHEALEINYKTKTIADVLEMSVDEAAKFFESEPAIADKLDLLVEVGLGYIKLGQSATTLSGGEAQRVKLATELARRATGRTLYILDEPTTGLHFEDIKRLLEVLNQLVEKGNSVLIIEHNLDVIKGADWIIDLGPEGGVHGGEIVATGTPKDIAKVKKSKTGEYLKMILARTKVG